MDILCLKYITKNLNNLQLLTIDVGGAVTVNDTNMAPEQLESIIQDFQLYCARI